MHRNQEKNERESRVRSVLENFNVDSKEFNKLAIPTLDGYELVKISNILYCQAQDNYCNMFTYTGKEILISKTLKFVSEELLTQEVFVRILARYPTEEEIAVAVAFLGKENDKAVAYQSFIWSLLATNEFLFNH